MQLPVEPPVAPMLAKASAAIPDRDDLQYEPKWDGFRCIVFRDGDEVVLASRNEKPLTRYFPELLDPLRRALPARCVVDGEIVIVTPDGLDFDLLSNRIHPADSRVTMLAEQTPASFVAFDLLAVDDRSLLDAPLRERRRLLEEALDGARPPVHLTPATTDRDLAEQWFEQFEGAGLDGVMAKPLDGTYTPGKRTLVKVKHQRTADCVVAGFRWHKSGDGIGSLLLGLYDAEGTLHHVGVATSFTAKRRAELVDEVAPWRDAALDEHPWRNWAEAEAHAAGSDGRLPGAPSRWNATKDLSWVPLRLGLVAEVAFEHLQRDRFRHSARLLRWRPDREPASCTYEQLDTVPPFELTRIFAG